MNIKIGNRIRELRAEHAITQEALAAAIGVTPQAVSRWESGNGYPDLEWLPLLADFFSVSMDELLGYRKDEREQRLAETKERICRLAVNGRLEERLRLAREAYRDAPSDPVCKLNLAICLYHQVQASGDQTGLSEAETLAHAVEETCRDAELRCTAIFLLVQIYAATGRPEQAKTAADRLTPMKYCRESVLSSGLGDGKNALYRQDEIDKLTDALGMAIRGLVLDPALPNDPSTWDRKVCMLETANALYGMIYGEDLLYHHWAVAEQYRLISAYRVVQGRLDDTLAALEQMCRHAVARDAAFRQDHGRHFTSPFVDQLPYPEPGEAFGEVQEHAQCWYLLSYLASARYDPVRGEARFQAVVDTLRASAW